MVARVFFDLSFFFLTPHAPHSKCFNPFCHLNPVFRLGTDVFVLVTTSLARSEAPSIKWERLSVPPTSVIRWSMRNKYNLQHKVRKHSNSKHVNSACYSPNSTIISYPKDLATHKRHSPKIHVSWTSTISKFVNLRSVPRRTPVVVTRRLWYAKTLQERLLQAQLHHTIQQTVTSTQSTSARGQRR